MRIMDELLIILIPSFLTAIGVISRLFWERKIKIRKELKQNRVKHLTFKLEKFYYPLYFNLSRLFHYKQIKNEIQCDYETIYLESIKIHEDNQKIIIDNIVKANPIQKLFSAIMKYDKHVTYIKLLKMIKSDNQSLKEYNADYPDEFRSLIQKRIEILESEIDNILII